ncbi:hypothetical protein ACOMHN_025865 [Nucella lapillus]
MQEILDRLGDPPPYPGPGLSAPEHTPQLPPLEGVTDLSCVVAPPSGVVAPMEMMTSARRTSSRRGREGGEVGVTSVTTDSGSEGTSDPGQGEGEGVDPGVDSGSDSDSEKSGTVRQLKMGPLKMAAMNGLTLSRSMVMALINDDSRAPKDERRRVLESKISEGQVFVEFEEIARRAGHLDVSVARCPHNQPRNRFKDVLPYDCTRVKLTPRAENTDGYINASHVKLSAADTDWWFIATQAPLADTTQDFWQMVWEQEVDVIAMLTPFQG